jgi:hypothetical protein
MYKQQIAKLQQQIKNLDEKILLAESDTNFDKDALKSMQSQRSMIYYEIQRLNKLQWEEDHERVSYDDERDR